MVTRCPLVMQLRNTEGQECAKIWTGQENEAEAELVDLAKIAETIDKKQKDLTAVGGAISREPIYLRIYKQDFFDLTLVDLPGLTYIGYQGIGPFICSIYTEYIKNPNSIVLYVTAATTDLTQSQAMEVVGEHDPEWQRTMTVATKVDLRDASFVRKFKLVDRGLGAFCVRNKTQAEVESGETFAQALNKERVALADPDFDEIATEQKGIPMLVKALIRHQREMILQFRPLIR